MGTRVEHTSIAVKQPVDGLMPLEPSLRAAVTGWAVPLCERSRARGVTVNKRPPGYTRTDRVTE